MKWDKSSFIQSSTVERCTIEKNHEQPQTEQNFDIYSYLKGTNSTTSIEISLLHSRTVCYYSARFKNCTSITQV